METKPFVFTCHEKIAYKGFMGALFFVAIVETIGMSFLLYKWNVYVHVVHLLMNVVLMLFLFIDTKKVINRPIWLVDNALHLAIGLRPKMVIPLENIQAVQSGSLHYQERRKKKEVLDLSLFVMEEPTLELVLKEPIAYKAFFGKKKEATHVFFFVDEKETLLSLVQARKTT